MFDRYLYIIDDKSENIFKLYFVANYRTDEYYFKVNDELTLKNYILENFSLYKNTLKTVNTDDVFKHLEKNAHRTSFSFGHGRYYYIKSEFEKC